MRFLLIISFLLLVLLGCTQTEVVSLDPLPLLDKHGLYNIDETYSTDVDDYFYLCNAISFDDINKCNNNQHCKDSFYNLRSIWEEENYCNEIKEKDLSDHCKSIILGTNKFDFEEYKSVYEKDIELCSEFKNENKQQDCIDEYLLYFHKKKDECEKINSLYMRIICKAKYKKPDLCYDIPNSVLLKKTMDTENAYFCTYFNDTKLSNMCIDTFVEHMANNTFNITYCEIITDTKRKENCILDISEQNYFESVKYNMEFSQCDSITMEKNKKLCVDAINYQKYLANKNVTYCHIINRTLWRERCLLDYSVNQKDEEVCKQISDKNFRPTCDAIFNMELNDCFKINDTSYRVYCFTQIIEFGGKIEQCKKLNDTNLISQCEDYFLGFII